MANSIRHILVATDFSENSKPAVQYAIALARPLGATLTLFHAYQIPAYVFPDGSSLVTPADEVATILTSVTGELAKLKAAVEAEGVKATVRSAEGPPVDAIVAAAREYDLVAMGTHGRTGFTHFLLGSVAERVVRHSTCPVLTVRSAS